MMCKKGASKLTNKKSSNTNGELIVQHNYHDHANENCGPFDKEAPPCRGGVTTPFLVKLHEFLDRIDKDGYGDVVSWQPHGRCFVIHKPKDLQVLLPTYFKVSKLASFIRQLNLYGFSRLTQGRDKGGYYHEFFLRDRQFLINKIHRIKVKGTKVRARSNPNAEPNFWEMTWVGNNSLNCSSSSSSSSSTPLPKNNKETVSDSRIVSDCSSVSCCGDSISSTDTLTTSGSRSSCSTKPESVSIICDPTIQVPSEVSSSSSKLCSPVDEVILSFGGNRFHYLDPSEVSQVVEKSLLDFSACSPNFNEGIIVEDFV